MEASKNLRIGVLKQALNKELFCHREIKERLVKHKLTRPSLISLSQKRFFVKKVHTADNRIYAGSERTATHN